MPTTSGQGVRTIADIVQLITHCTKPQADAAEKAITSSRENLAALSKSTGLNIAGVSTGGTLIIGEAGKAENQVGGSAIIPAALLTGANMADAKRFCHAAILGAKEKNGTHISRNIASSLGVTAAGSGSVLGAAGSSSGRRG